MHCAADKAERPAVRSRHEAQRCVLKTQGGHARLHVARRHHRLHRRPAPGVGGNIIEPQRPAHRVEARRVGISPAPSLAENRSFRSNPSAVGLASNEIRPPAASTCQRPSPAAVNASRLAVDQRDATRPWRVGDPFRLQAQRLSGPDWRGSVLAGLVFVRRLMPADAVGKLRRGDRASLQGQASNLRESRRYRFPIHRCKETPPRGQVPGFRAANIARFCSLGRQNLGTAAGQVRKRGDLLPSAACRSGRVSALS